MMEGHQHPRIKMPMIVPAFAAPAAPAETAARAALTPKPLVVVHKRRTFVRENAARRPFVA